MSKPTFYITTPIYYVNAAPHLGTAYTTMAADATARWHRMDGYDVHFLTGLDEHGQKVAESAAEKGMTPQEWCDSMAPRFQEMWKSLCITNDQFIRTTDKRHVEGVQHFWEVLRDRGYIYKDSYEGWYCVPEETYFTETQVRHAAEQAEAEGHPWGTDEHLCPDCGRPLERLAEESWFFKLSAFGDRLLDLYEKHPSFVEPEIRRNEVTSFVKSGLKDLSISRTTFDWGIPLPFDDEHVTYVWFDALLNYITAIGYGSPDAADGEQFEHYWPANIHFVGKDIIRFHCVIWPAMLMAAGLELPDQIFAHGFLLTKGEKMSKSRGNAVSPYDLISVFGVDAYRYYFLSDVQFGSDGSISLERMVQVYNADLANQWGNLCSRVFNMCGKYFEGKVPAFPESQKSEDNPLRDIAEKLYERYHDAMEAVDFSGAVAAVGELCARANSYVEESAPWNLAKSTDGADKLAAVIYNVLEAIRIMAIFYEPFMPNTSAEVFSRLSLEALADVDDAAKTSAWGGLPAGNTVSTGDPLFPRIKIEDIDFAGM